MSTESTTETEVDAKAFQLAKNAVNYTLRRIGEDENIRYHLGAGTEAYSRLQKARAAFTGQTEEAIDNEVFKLSRPLKYKPNAELLREVKDVLDESWATSDDRIKKIRAILGR